MSSPFATYEEFEGAIDGPTGGAMYTFAHTPTINAIALLIGASLFVWFLARTFKSHYDLPIPEKALSHLSTFIVAGLLSLAGLEHRQTVQPHQSEARAEAVLQRPSSKATLGLLGLVGVGLPIRQRWSKTAPKGPSRRKGLYRNIGSSR
ncbi:hypothetical protein [Phormidium tenue]|uniref:Uncharacterized protein n=1 Tax=Phormidium tenue NIES-30 TaxID=549789 RepID=A0A1U7J8M2_9CYAN|nr:hypothetical protein [Phormidium tenue]MBD2231118.1 hypothetical protein [Phormidium tenue FACHB-1052]OKH49857.1 hypothetical protein NIES30_03845 [Phormidium tenue NIES-30]